MEIYHGSSVIVDTPEIRITKFTKDFSWGFYCTKSYQQAERRAKRDTSSGFVNVYSYTVNPSLKILKFNSINEEWLDFIAKCRNGYVHDFDIVEGPMADDAVWNFAEAYIRKEISKEVFLEFAKFKHPTHQISFHTIKALQCLEFIRGDDIYGKR